MRDLVVVGGGPAGLMTAILAAEHGLEVAIVEARPGVIDKACGEGLMPGAWHELQRLGVSADVGHPLTGVRYQHGLNHVQAAFIEPGRGLRRLELHRALLRRAEGLGIEQVTASVRDVHQHPDHVVAAGLRARFLVAADGLRSPLRTLLGLDHATRWPPRYGVRRHFAMSPWSSEVEVHWADDAEAYVTPVGADLVGVALLFGERGRRALAGTSGTPFDKLMTRFPDLRARLASPATAARGAGPFARHARRRVLHRVLLVGDAAGYLDPLTGEGLKLAARGARAAVHAIAEGRPERYESDWKRIYRPYAVLTGGLLLLTRPRWARQRLVSLLQRAPWVMAKVVRQLAS